MKLTRLFFKFAEHVSQKLFREDGGGDPEPIAIAVVVLLRDGRSGAMLAQHTDYPGADAFVEDIRTQLVQSWPGIEIGSV